MSPKLVARMVTHPSRVLENISVSFLDANASLYWDNTFPVKPFTDFLFKIHYCDQLSDAKKWY